MRRTGIAVALAASVLAGLAVATPAQAIVNGKPAEADDLAFTGWIEIGRKECSVVLVDRLWALTAARCLGEPGSLTTGPPPQPTTITVGATKRAWAGRVGHRGPVAEIVPRVDRDLVLLKLSLPADYTKPADLATGPAGENERLVVAGYGATATSYQADNLETATFQAGAPSATGFPLTEGQPSGASVCAVDLGGPVLRAREGRTELLGVLASTPRTNCREPVTTDPVGAVRVDDLGDWIGQVIRERSRVPGLAAGNIIELRHQETGWCASLDRSTTPHLGQCHGVSGEQWELLGNDEFQRLRNLRTRRCLSATEEHPNQIIAAQEDCHAGAGGRQLWRIEQGRAPGSVQVRNEHHQTFLSQVNGNPGAHIGLRPFSGPFRDELFTMSQHGRARHDLPTKASLAATNPGLDQHYLRHARGEGWLNLITAASPELDKADASFRLVSGLADPTCYSIEAGNIPGAYLRHRHSRIRLDTNDNSPLFAADATFCARDGLGGAGVSWQSWNFPDNRLRHIRGEVWNARKGGREWFETEASYEADVSWRVAPPLIP